MLPGETLQNGAEEICSLCGCIAEVKPMSSAAGWYLGSACGCGPYTRESVYYPSRERLDIAIREDMVEPRFSV